MSLHATQPDVEPSRTEFCASLPVSVVILTFNEQDNLGDCIRSCAATDDVHIVDAGSTDNTCQLARSLGAHVHQHAFFSFGQQRNWAIDHISHKYSWVFHLDADERLTPQLVKEIGHTVRSNPSAAGFYVPHKLIFMNRWVRFAEGYPVYQVRLFHRDRLRFRDVGHGQRELTSGELRRLHQPYIHCGFLKGIEDWIAKHNRYSTLEAEAMCSRSIDRAQEQSRPSFRGGSTARRRSLQQLRGVLPLPWLWRFFYLYVVRLGFLDGRAGLHYSLLMAFYELMIDLKVRERRSARAATTGERSQ